MEIKEAQRLPDLSSGFLKSRSVYHLVRGFEGWRERWEGVIETWLEFEYSTFHFLGNFRCSKMYLTYIITSVWSSSCVKYKTFRRKAADC